MGEVVIRAAAIRRQNRKRHSRASAVRGYDHTYQMIPPCIESAMQGGKQSSKNKNYSWIVLMDLKRTFT